MTVLADTIVDLAQSQAGDAYVYGAEVGLDDPNPRAFDCSELVQWAVHRAGGEIPDGSAAQLAWCKKHGTMMEIAGAYKVRGALLFIQKAGERHVVISRGNGTTIEARGHAYGVGNWQEAGRPWTHAARIPGVDYTPQPPAPPPVPVEGRTPLCRVVLGRGQVWHPEVHEWSVQPASQPWWEFSQIQWLCNRKGISDGHGHTLIVDGIAGPVTAAAILEAQKRGRLLQDGVCGPSTWGWLRS